MNDITSNFIDLRGRIESAAKEAGRDAASVTLVAVSKVQPPEKLQAALDCGHRIFGENRVQEAWGHWEEARMAYPDLRLHLIGGLQTNKAAEAVALFDVIETIDRERIVDAVANEAAKQSRSPTCLIQVNTGEEPQKGGVLPQNLEALFEYARTKAGLKIAGLMCIPPVDAPPILHFGLLTSWAKRLGLEAISMGMSGDFEEAIRMGATHVRVGSALFGERVKA